MEADMFSYALQAILLASAILVGCGEGQSPRAVTVPRPPPAPPPEPEPEVEPLEKLENLAKSGDVDRIFLSDFVGELQLADVEFGTLRVTVTCDGGTCTMVSGRITDSLAPDMPFPINETVSVSDFDPEEYSQEDFFAGDPEISDLHGMHSFQVDASEAGFLADVGQEDGEGKATFWGGWGTYQMFGVIAMGLSETESGLAMRMGAGLSLGDVSGSVPSGGSATWTGALVGVEKDRFETVSGKSSIVIRDFPNPVVDASLTEISTPGRQIGDVTYTGVPVTDSGFQSATEGHSIQGSFYGPNHEEAGGIFESEQVLGAFGAKRP